MWKKNLKKAPENKNYQKVRDNCLHTDDYRVVADSICDLRFDLPNEIPVVFHNSWNYDYHFIKKELANKFEGNFECLETQKNTKRFPFQ